MEVFEKVVKASLAKGVTERHYACALSVKQKFTIALFVIA